jgi:hypothetical protein
MKLKNLKFALSVLSVVAGTQLPMSVAQARSETLVKDVMPNLTGIAKDADGSILKMNQEDADRYCRYLGLRLPTARELALYSQSQGARGIGKPKKRGYNLVLGSDSSGNEDRFSFLVNGYERPTGELGNNWFWSSSVYPDDSHLAYLMDGRFGFIYLGMRNIGEGSVRCVQ